MSFSIEFPHQQICIGVISDRSWAGMSFDIQSFSKNGDRQNISNVSRYWNDSYISAFANKQPKSSVAFILEPIGEEIVGEKRGVCIEYPKHISHGTISNIEVASIPNASSPSVLINDFMNEEYYNQTSIIFQSPHFALRSTQRFYLKQGWNELSFNVQNENTSVDKVFENLSPSNVTAGGTDRILNRHVVCYGYVKKWICNSPQYSFTSNQTYKIYLNEDKNFSYEGKHVSFPLTMNAKGYNDWPMPYQTNRSIENYVPRCIGGNYSVNDHVSTRTGVNCFYYDAKWYCTGSDTIEPGWAILANTNCTGNSAVFTA